MFDAICCCVLYTRSLILLIYLHVNLHVFLKKDTWTILKINILYWKCNPRKIKINQSINLSLSLSKHSKHEDALLWEKLKLTAWPKNSGWLSSEWCCPGVPRCRVRANCAARWALGQEDPSTTRTGRTEEHTNTRIPSGKKSYAKFSLHSYIPLQAGANFGRNREIPGEVAYTLVHIAHQSRWFFFAPAWDNSLCYWKE